MSMPSFLEFYSALYSGRAPFPWQIRLAAQVLRDGWPTLLDLPTGVGKTSALDVALYTLACAPERMPRRTVLVVDRRLVVDQGATHARALLARLTDARTGPLKLLTDALRALWRGQPDDPPFAVAIMRGGMPRDNDWAKRPDQPVLGISTVDQVGSRLLFRGYGVSPMSASIHAGLIGNDTLLLLDEVHLSVPFAQTLDAIRNRFRRTDSPLPQRFLVVAMSATPGAGTLASARFGLDEKDRNHDILRRRLDAKKPASLVTLKVSGDDEAKKRAAIAERAVREALRLQTTGASVVGIVVNRVDTARLAINALRAHSGATDSLLVTGRMRPLERDELVRTELIPRAGAGREPRQGARPLIVVATQCIEAGADLDFDGLVTECASLDALKQRFGRLDRRGDRTTSEAVILGRSDLVSSEDPDPIYGTALGATWRWLNEIASDGVVDFGVTSLPPAQASDGGPRLDLLAPADHAPVLLPSHLDAWAQTAPRPPVEPDVAMWLHGPQRPTADVQIIWRAGLIPEELSACRPSSLEAITLPIAIARRWLSDAPTGAIADVVFGAAEEPDEPERRERNRAGEGDVVALRWTGDDSRWIRADEIRAGDILIVDVARGGIAAGNFDPESKASVRDLGDIAQLRGRGIATMRITPSVIPSWGAPFGATSLPLPDSEELAVDTRERVRAWLDELPDTIPEGGLVTGAEWRMVRDAWRSKRAQISTIDNHLFVSARLSRRDLARQPELTDALTEDDDSSFRHVEVTLRQHSDDVRQLATQFAQAVGFGTAISDDIGLAAWLHDVGKKDPRFQRWLVGGSEVRAAILPEPLAKSALPAGSAVERRRAQERAGYPVGYRHELLSLEMIESSFEAVSTAHDRDLVLHLVASHHGWCRPFAPALDHPDAIDVRLDHGGMALHGSTRHRRSRLDSGVADRFWSLIDRYGWWGLAWLEAVMRLADHRASEMEAGE